VSSDGKKDPVRDIGAFVKVGADVLGRLRVDQGGTDTRSPN